MITLYESLGKEIYVVEDYTGKNSIEVKTLLENVYHLSVKVEEKDGEAGKEYSQDEIIGQSVKVGTKLSEGDEIVLYVAKIYDSYPNMVEDGWMLEDVQSFCNQYNITLTVDYEQTSQYTPGMVISQSRAPKTPIVSGTTLKVTIAQEPSSGDDDTGRPPATDDPASDLLP